MKPMAQLLKHGRFLLDYYLTARRSAIILSAGMPRSGSTWLFNAARLLLQSCGDVSSGWIGDFATLPKKPLLLLKVHDYNSFLAGSAKIILYSYRDIRDALASSKRKFGIEPTLELARKWIAQDRRWRARADFILRYETMMADPESAIKELARILQVPLVRAPGSVSPSLSASEGIKNTSLKRQRRKVTAISSLALQACEFLRWRFRFVKFLRWRSGSDKTFLAIGQEDPQSILEQVQQLTTHQTEGRNSTYHKDTLLHPGHITDGRHGSWEEWLDPALVQRIEKEFAGWLRDNEYPTGTTLQARAT